MTKTLLALTAILLIATACTTTRFENTRALKADQQLIAGTNVVVYSFLDVHNEFFGETMVQVLHRELVSRLAQNGVTARVVVYKQAEPDAKASTAYYTSNRQAVVIPLKDFLLSQKPEETKARDKYRLLIQPWYMQSHQATTDVRITWTLTDIATDQPVWTTNQQTSRLVMISSDETPETRAKEIVDGIVTQMRASNLFSTEKPTATP